jgi:16S rRNA A1518/A1519 N6-dimethyltransferase RsmA/KsgA/DIM1 with predicted DNA glycosylase/AP lyase activity
VNQPPLHRHHRPQRPPPRPPARPGNDLQQHDLHPDAAAAVVANAHLPPRETVLEVGAGRGALTAALLKAKAVVHAVERDPARCRHLADRFPQEIARKSLILHPGDAIAIAPALAGPWRVVANPPFNLTSSLVRRWLLDPPGDPPTAIDVVLQYEAGKKLCGSDGAHTRSSPLMRLIGKPWISMRLQREQVDPPSRVSLCVWSLRRVASAPPLDELRRIDRLLEIAFAGPHSVAEALRGVATNVQLRRQGQEHGWDPAAHARTLKPSAWRHLATLLASCGKL